MPPEIRLLGPEDSEVLQRVAPGVFDGPVQPRWAREFLGDERHHLVVALDEGWVVGMVSALHYVHPDKAPQLWINEIGVAPSHRRRGIGRQLLNAILAHGRTLGCTEAWLGTEETNVAARRLYDGAAGAHEPFMLYSFPLEEGDPQPVPAGRLTRPARLSSRTSSGRPLDGEFADYARPDIDQVVGDDAIEVLTAQSNQVLALLEPLGESLVSGRTYAPGKWTLKEVVGHLADDERIFAYRALCIARGDSRQLAGFDEKAYVEHAGFETRSLTSLLADYRAVRHATITLLGDLGPEAWLRRGIVNGYTATVRGLAFHIAGHELRHLRALREKYLRQPA